MKPLTATTTPALKKSVKLVDLVMLGAGTAMGASVFSVLGPAAQLAGSGLLITLLIAMAPAAIFGLVYAFIASAVPRTGASFEWQRTFVHPVVGFSVAWLRVMGSALLMVAMGNALLNYLSLSLDLPPRPVIFGLFTLIFVLNTLGTAVAARAQTVLMIFMLAAFAIFILVGAPKISPGRIGNPLASGILPILAALPLMIQLFLGIETATELGEEVRDARKTIPMALGLSLGLTGLVYLLLALTALGLIGPAALAASKAPLLSAAKAGLGPPASVVIMTAAVLALTKSMNAIFMVYSRSLFAMGRSGMLPSAMGWVHPRTGAPYIAIVVAYLGSSLALILPGDLIFLFLAINIPTMMKYAATCLAAFNIVRHRPDIMALARLRLAPPILVTLSLAGMVAAVTIAAIGLKTDWRPYALLGAWLAVGLVWREIRTRTNLDLGAGGGSHPLRARL